MDGSAHSQPSQMRKDAAKDKYLEGLGIRVLRIPNRMPLEDPEAFFRQIRKYMLPSPVPTSRDTLSQRERGGKSLEAGAPSQGEEGRGNLLKRGTPKGRGEGKSPFRCERP